MGKVIALWVFAFCLTLVASKPWENEVNSFNYGNNVQNNGWNEPWPRGVQNYENLARANNGFGNFQNVPQRLPSVPVAPTPPAVPTRSIAPTLPVIPTRPVAPILPAAPVIPNYEQNIFNQNQVPVYQQHQAKAVTVEANSNQNNYAQPQQRNFENYKRLRQPQIQYQNNQYSNQQALENYAAPQQPQQQVHPALPPHVEVHNVSPNWLHEHIANILRVPNAAHVPITPPPQSAHLTHSYSPVNVYHHALATNPVYHIGPVAPIPTISTAVTDAIAAANDAINSAAAATVATTAAQQKVLALIHQVAVFAAGANIKAAPVPGSVASATPISPPSSDPAVTVSLAALNIAVIDAQTKADAAQTAQNTAQQKIVDAVAAVQSATKTIPSVSVAQTPSSTNPSTTGQTTNPASVSLPTNLVSSTTSSPDSALSPNSNSQVDNTSSPDSSSNNLPVDASDAALPTTQTNSTQTNPDSTQQSSSNVTKNADSPNNPTSSTSDAVPIDSNSKSKTNSETTLSSSPKTDTSPQNSPVPPTSDTVKGTSNDPECADVDEEEEEGEEGEE